MRSTIAFLAMDWISDGLNNLLLIEDAFFTQNFPSSGIYSSHGRFLIPWKSSSKVVALNLPTWIITRSAVRRKILARQTASSSPSNVTLPSSTFVISYPRSYISLFKTASNPKWQGTSKSNVLTEISSKNKSKNLFLYYLFYFELSIAKIFRYEMFLRNRYRNKVRVHKKTPV